MICNFEQDDSTRKRPSFGEDIATVSGSILDVLTGDAGSAESSSNIMETFPDSTRDGRHGSPSFPSSYIPSPEATSPALDATFYYVLCTMVLLAAVFGNFLLVSTVEGECL